MPGMDGFETAALIRRAPRSEHTPIIFITAYGDETHVARGYSLGAVDYILTPVVPEVLRTKVGVFVELFRTTAEVRRQAESLRRRAEQLHRLAAGRARPINARARSRRAAIARASWPRAPGARSIAREASTVTRAPCRAAGQRSTRVGPAAVGPRRTRRDAAAARSPCRSSTRDGTQHRRASRSCAGRRAASTRGRGRASLQLAQMASIADREPALQRGARGEPPEGRVPGDALARAAHAAQRHPHLGARCCARRRSTPTAARGLEVIERNARAQAQLIDDLLDISRIITGKLRLERRARSTLARSSTAARRVGAARRPTRKRHRARVRASTGRAGRAAAIRSACSRWSGTCSPTRSSSRRAGGRVEVAAAARDDERRDRR